jgi:hypothetical protein
MSCCGMAAFFVKIPSMLRSSILCRNGPLGGGALSQTLSIAGRGDSVGHKCIRELNCGSYIQEL